MLKQLVKRAAITGGLELSAILSRAGLMGAARGLGAIFTLHHVRPYAPRHVAPNRHLEITPDFLEAAILRLKASGYRFVRLNEIPRLLSDADRNRRLRPSRWMTAIATTGTFALPVFERHGVPFTIFVCKGFLSGAIPSGGKPPMPWPTGLNRSTFHRLAATGGFPLAPTGADRGVRRRLRSCRRP